MHTRLKHHLPVPSQYRGDGPRFRGKRERVRTQKMPSSKRRWNAEKENSKAHVSFTSQELNKYQSMQQNQANTEAMANA